MRVRLIGTPVVEATVITSSKASPLAKATDVLLETGLVAQLAAHGADVEQISRPVLPDDQRSDDPIENLGRYNRLVADALAQGVAAGQRPLLAGGTCNHLIGMMAGLQQAYGRTSRIGLVWLDAHGDFNTPKTTLSGMLGGMPVAVASGLCHPSWRELAGQSVPLSTDRIVFVDVRNLDPAEATLIDATAATVARFGPDFDPEPVVAAIRDLASRVDHLYLHVDSDILDASLQPNHPTVEPNGPGEAAVHAVMAAAGATGKVRAAAVVSINPDEPGGSISLASGRGLIQAAAAALAKAEPAV